MESTGQEIQPDVERGHLHHPNQRAVPKLPRGSSTPKGNSKIAIDIPSKTAKFEDDDAFVDMDDDKYGDKLSTAHYSRKKSRRASYGVLLKSAFGSTHSVGSGYSSPRSSQMESPLLRHKRRSCFKRKWRCVGILMCTGLIGFFLGWLQGSALRNVAVEMRMKPNNLTRNDVDLAREDPNADLTLINMNHSTLSTPEATLDHMKSGKDRLEGTANRWKRFAIAVKTGSATAVRRVPIQLMTFLKDVENIILVGESSGVYVGSKEIMDVCTRLYDDGQEKPKDWEKIFNTLNSHSYSLKDPHIHDENSMGWKLDAHKNLPGIKLLFDKFPDADWYLMIDDDTYIHLENLEDALKSYDPTAAIYLGNRSRFKGCDGVGQLQESSMFAHGGSGIFMSRGALQKVVHEIPKCISKYKECWAGDIRLGLCFRDVGVSVNQMPHVSVDPPSNDFSFPPDPCTNPISYHHLTPEQFQSLYNASRTSLAELEAMYIEWKRTATATQLQLHRLSSLPNIAKTTASDVFQQWQNELILSETEQDYDREGNDHLTSLADDYRVCRDYCQSHAECTAWSWKEQKCLLKKGIPKRVAVKGYWSGVFKSKYKCKRELKFEV